MNDRGTKRGALRAARGDMTRMTARDFEGVAATEWAIRPEQPVDLDQIHELHREAFGRREEAELVDAIRTGKDFIPELSLVAAAADGSVLGHVLVSRIGFEEEAYDVRGDVLALAPIAVLPPHAGRGIGTALTRGVLATVDERDEPFTFVLGSPAFFGQFGFVPAADFGIESPYAGAGRAFQVRSRRGGPAPVAGTVFYPPMFEQLR
jgi:putative acetyltransferase